MILIYISRFVARIIPIMALKGKYKEYQIIEEKLEDSNETIKDLENQLNEAKIFLDLDEESKEIIINKINEIKSKKMISNKSL